MKISWLTLALNVALIHFLLGMGIAAEPGATFGDVYELANPDATAAEKASVGFLRDSMILPWSISAAFGWDCIALSLWYRNRRATL